SDKLDAGDAGLLAFEAGADILISDADPEGAFRKIKKVLHAEKHYATRLDIHVKKVLGLKYDAGLSKAPIQDVHLSSNLHSLENQVLRSKAYRESITVVRNERNALPITLLEGKNFATVVVGDTSDRADIFHRVVRKYVSARRYNVDDDVPSIDLSREDVILVSLFPGTSKKSLQNLMGVLQELAANQQVIVADFGCRIFQAYATRFQAIITGYTDEKDVVGLVPQMIFGAHAVSGVLPVAFGDIASGTAISTRDLDRLAYSFPEDAGIDSETLQRINTIANEAISSGSTPGCYVLVAKDGKVVYDHAFGHLTYEQKHPVNDETIYDLASLTKVAATLQAVMFMEEHELIDIYKKMSVYLPELKGTNKKNITVIDALTHQSGLTPFVPLWPLTLEGPALKPIYYSSQQNVSYPLQIAPRLFGSPILKDSVWSWIISSKMLEKPVRTPYSYRYSDLGFMMFKQLAERGLNQPLDDFLQQNFYEPLGAYSLGYTPLSRFPAETIAPTELDTLFRGGLLIGTVHDERAAMLGGVSGHAGLFGTANDLSKLGQMLLQEGSYGGLQYYKPETVRQFTSRQFASSRRGLGWDKPVPGEWNSPTSRYASPKTFGHTGFTGTCLWVDPEFDLVYIFLSNRVFPDRSDKLIQTNIRSRIQDVIYEAIFNFRKTNESGM
ncbi:MAG TPA: serine hydrolase, partial [Chryseosolibacter sp.]|nr:serine hydrolase [Chryseosolibacter sp.]